MALLNYPYQAMAGNVIYTIINTSIIPQFNESLAAVLTNPITISSANVIYGDADAISEPTICFYVKSNTPGMQSLDLMVHNFVGVVSLRLPYASAFGTDIGNEWEAYARTGDLFCDCVANQFSTKANLTLAPQNSSGQAILPATNTGPYGVLFNGSMGYQKVRSSEHKLLYFKWDCYLQLLVNSNIDRSGV